MENLIEAIYWLKNNTDLESLLQETRQQTIEEWLESCGIENVPSSDKS